MVKVTSTMSERNITITLSESEAVILRSVFDSVGGNEDGPRAVTNAISNQLREMGVATDWNMTTGHITLDK